MTVKEQIKNYISSQPEPKQSEMKELHKLMGRILPKGRLWYDDGKNEQNKTVANPTIGYGLFTIKYAGGKTKEFFQVGVSANTTGISVYILGLKDKKYLPRVYGNKIGKASVTGYCIKFKSLEGINLGILEEAIVYGIKNSLEE